MAYSPLGKFSSAQEELLYTLAASEQWAEEETGNSTDWSLYGWAISIEAGSLDSDNLETVQRWAGDIDSEDGELVSSIYGHWIVWENSSGMVSVSKFETEEELSAAWTQFESDYSDWAGEDEEL
jgi:hypothetical protein